jgi:hypothetical protein
MFRYTTTTITLHASATINGVYVGLIYLKQPPAFIFIWENNSVLFQTKYFNNFILEKCTKTL